MAVNRTVKFRVNYYSDMPHQSRSQIRFTKRC